MSDRILEEMQFAEWWSENFGAPANQTQEMVQSTSRQAWLAGVEIFSSLWKISQNIAKAQVRVNAELRKENNALKDAALSSAQGEELPERPKHKLTQTVSGVPVFGYSVAEVDACLEKLEAEIRRLKEERDAAYQETALSGNRLGERYEAYCETNPKPMMTFSGWLNKRIGDAETAEQALSASRAEALKEAAAAICDYCKHRPETPPENRDGIWFHPETAERADGTTYDDSPTCRAQAILARMEKVS